MTCYTPLRMYRSKYGPSQKTGKISLTSAQHGNLKQGVTIPCGRCIGCRLERSRQWAIRCEHERKFHNESSFVTLTYRDDALIYGGTDRPTLYPLHLQLFWKKLRKELARNGISIRYFACGEYGDQFNRPHYHAIVFGYDWPDKVHYSTKNGHTLYTSDSLTNLWGHGDCRLGTATFESSAYVARYICDKHLGNDSDYYTQNGIEPEFVRMSRRPGIGAKFLDEYFNDIYTHDTIVIRGGVQCRPPRYYDRQLEKYSPYLLQKLKLKRKLQYETSVPDDDPRRLRVKQRVKLAQIRSLSRKLTP